MIVKYFFLFWLAILHVLLATGQNEKIEYPKFEGPNGTLENHILKQFEAHKKSRDLVCDNSLGMIEFYIDKNGKSFSLTIPANFPEEVKKIVSISIQGSQWRPMKIDEAIVESSTIVLPIFISIETGCKEGEIRKSFGLGSDFVNMLSFRNEPFRSCLLLKPIFYTGPMQ